MTKHGGIEPLLAVHGLKVEARRGRKSITLAHDVSFHVDPSETLVLLGESGSGKSLTSLAAIGLLPGGVHRTAGSVRIAGVEVATGDSEAHRKFATRHLAMIYQDASTALNPTMRVGEQVLEAVARRDRVGRRKAKERALELLRDVKIPAPEERFYNYPHEFSGGMRQRIVIAIALALRPKVLIADEPTTALDVTVQAQILELLMELKEQFNMALLLITHDLAVAESVADRVVVMYAGRIVESGAGNMLFSRPLHPYTDGLLRSVPNLDAPLDELTPIPGSPPVMESLPTGCSFHPRCPLAVDQCARERPELLRVPGFAAQGSDRNVACHVVFQQEGGVDD